MRTLKLRLLPEGETVATAMASNVARALTLAFAFAFNSKLLLAPWAPRHPAVSSQQ